MKTIELKNSPSETLNLLTSNSVACPCGGYFSGRKGVYKLKMIQLMSLLPSCTFLIYTDLRLISTNFYWNNVFILNSSRIFWGCCRIYLLHRSMKKQMHFKIKYTLGIRTKLSQQVAYNSSFFTVWVSESTYIISIN